MSNGVNFKDLCIDLRGQLDRVTAERDALQQRLTEADQREDDRVSLEHRHRAEFEACQAAERRVEILEAVSIKQAALLEELGIPLNEVDDLFGETLKNAKRYEYLRSVMAAEEFPGPHPEWSTPSEAESRRIDELCDAALNPTAEGASQ